MTHSKNTKQQENMVGSSETIRKTPDFYLFSHLVADQKVYTKPFDWSQIQPHMPQHLHKYSPQFLEWFVGFSEGDGSFFSSGDRLFFTITQKDPALLYKLRTQLGFGVICNDTQNPEIKRFTVTDRKWIRVLIHIFNGNLLLRKTQSRFTLWLQHWNQITGDTIECINRWDSSSVNPKHPDPGLRVNQNPQMSACWRQTSQVCQTGWLAGFLEAEGCFAAGFEKRKPVLRFILDQTGELEILAHLRLLLGDYGSVWIRKSTQEQNGNVKHHYRFETKHREEIENIIDYISRHPLRTKKRIVYVRWQKLYNRLDFIRDDQNITPKRQERMTRLVDEISNWAKKT